MKYLFHAVVLRSAMEYCIHVRLSVPLLYVLLSFTTLNGTLNRVDSISLEIEREHANNGNIVKSMQNEFNLQQAGNGNKFQFHYNSIHYRCMCIL